MFSNKTIPKPGLQNKNIDKNLNFTKKSKLNVLIDEIYNILYEKEFPSILLISSKNFLKNIDTQTESLLKKNLTNDEYCDTSTIKSIEKSKAKLLNRYNFEYSFLYEKYKNYIENPYNFLYLTHFRKHCNKCDKIAYHRCSKKKSGKVICIKQSHQILYYLCTACNKCLRNNYLNLYCNNCDEEYISSDKNIEENNETLYPATWGKYHCYILKDEIMRCLNCQEYLYLMKPENKLVCLDKKCNFSVKPEGILWNCSHCGVEFLSPAKIYEDDLVNVFKKAIKYTLLNKEIAKPVKALFCCGKYLNNENFFHNMNCDGILYKGQFNNKDIIVCEKCEYNNYLDDFVWTCPYCKREIQNSNNINAKYRVKNFSRDSNKDSIKNDNNQYQNIRVNRKFEKSLDMSKKTKNIEKTEVEKKQNEFNKLIPIKVDILNNSSNKNTCTSTYSSTKSNNNYNHNHYTYSTRQKDSSFPSKTIKTNSLTKSRYQQFKDNNLLSKTLTGEEFNIFNKIRNNFIYSTREKKNKMFKIKNRKISNSTNNHSKDGIIINKDNNEQEGKCVPRNEVFNFRPDRSVNFNDLQIDSRNISNKVNFDAEFKIRQENLTEIKNLKNIFNINYNNYSTLRNTICFTKKLFRKKRSQFVSMKNLQDTNNNINKIPHIHSFIENRKNLSDKYKFANKNLMKLQRRIQGFNQNYYNPVKTNNTNQTINTENIYTNSNNNSYKINNTEDQIKFNFNEINKNPTSQNIISKKLNPPDFRKMEMKETNGFILNKVKNKNDDGMYLSENIEKKKSYKKKLINNKIYSKTKLNDSIKQIKVKHIIHISNRSNYQKKYSYQKPEENASNNSKTSNNNNSSNYNSISYIQSNNKKNNDFPILNKNNNNNNILKIGLINHKNLVSSPDKLNDIIKNCTIPTFEDNDFEYIEPIGEGSYGTIFLVKELNTNNQYALKKIICQDCNDVLKLKAQLELHYSLKHDNIMQIYKIQFKCLDFTTYGINVLMERASLDWGMEISKRTKEKKYYTEKELINIAKQIINSLQFLQTKNIAHRDIKPENILIYPNNIYKIADLGEAKNVNNIKSKLYTLKGSEKYLSPALLEGLKHNKNGIIHNVYKSDVFSLGYCFLYAMSLDINVLDKIRNEESKNNDKEQNDKTFYNFINIDRYSEKFLQFIEKMVVDNEAQRYDFIQLNKMLNEIE